MLLQERYGGDRTLGGRRYSGITSPTLRVFTQLTRVQGAFSAGRMNGPRYTPVCPFVGGIALCLLFLLAVVEFLVAAPRDAAA